MKIANKSKVLFVIIPILVLVGTILLQRQKHETSSENHGKQLSHNWKINQTTNNTNKVGEQDLKNGLVKSPEKKPLQIAHPLTKDEKLLTTDDSLDIELPNLFDDGEFDLPIHGFQMLQAWKAQDGLMNTWPAYSIVQEELRNELLSKMDLNEFSDEEIIQTAQGFRENFWNATKELSTTSYQDAYKARILLEYAHDRNPENLLIIDELVPKQASSLGLPRSGADDFTRT